MERWKFKNMDNWEKLDEIVIKLLYEKGKTYENESNRVPNSKKKSKKRIT